MNPLTDDGECDGADLLALRALVLVAFVLAMMAVWAQPKLADDWYLTWRLVESGTLTAYLSEMYLGWGGRLLTFGLGGLALTSDAATAVFKLLTVPCFMFMPSPLRPYQVVVPCQSPSKLARIRSHCRSAAALAWLSEASIVFSSVIGFSRIVVS